MKAMQQIRTVTSRLTAFRRAHLFITPGEARALASAIQATAAEFARGVINAECQDARQMEQQARDLFFELQQIKVEAHTNVRQCVEIKLTLDRRSLACVDITTAADVLGERCKYLFREQLQRRLG